MQTSVSSKLKKCHRVHFVHFSPSLIFRTLNVYNRSTFSRAEGIILVILFIFSINSCTNRKNVSSATHILIILISFSPFYIIIFNVLLAHSKFIWWAFKYSFRIFWWVCEKIMSIWLWLDLRLNVSSSLNAVLCIMPWNVFNLDSTKLLHWNWRD